jgi:toxin ParE1/3/4
VTPVIWAPQAIEDVEAIRTYVARDSAHYADLLVERIVAAVGRLDRFPRSGRVVPEVGDESLREVVYENYRIVYRVMASTVEIITVFHGARLLRLE